VRVLRRVGTPASPKPRRSSRARAAALGLAALTCCLAASGCASFDKALGQQSVDVYFQENVSIAFKMHVRAACNNLPDVKAEPIATGVPLASAIDVVVYNTTGANTVDIARLGECLNKFSPQVEGINSQDSSDDS
jgi:hypothetical protein